MATDGKGKPVTDLTKEEILVTENGQPRELAFFRFEGRYTPDGHSRYRPGNS